MSSFQPLIAPEIFALRPDFHAISILADGLRNAIPVGGECADAYTGAPRLVRAAGSEVFETMQSGAPITEAPEPGEVIWRDDPGVTCRRWNWRQGTRTRIEASSTRMWFILEALGAMPEATLMAAGAELVRGLRDLSPGAVIDAQLLACGGARKLAGEEFA